MIPGSCFPDLRPGTVVTNRYPDRPRSNALDLCTSRPDLEATFDRITTNIFSLAVDPDPLTPIEIADLYASMADLAAGRACILPAEMSDEDFLASL